MPPANQNGGFGGGHVPPPNNELQIYTPGSSNSLCSANGGDWFPFSDPGPRKQSEGHRPPLCGLMQSLWTAVDIASEIGQEVLEATKGIQDKLDPLQERLYNAIKDTSLLQALQEEVRGRPFSCLNSPPSLNRFLDVRP
jgi:hypothetical protein